MQIIDINWLSKSFGEAEVIVSDGSYICAAYSMPCDAFIGQVLQAPLHVFSICNLMRSDAGGLRIDRIKPTGLAQFLVAAVADVKKKYLSVGGLNFVLDDNLPGDIKDGDLVEFECARIDMW